VGKFRPDRTAGHRRRPGYPANAIAWLAVALVRFGVVLEAGHVLTGGSLTAAIPLEPGPVVPADFGPLGDVEARVEA
jgi:2-keto-4-pentenoate hydratase